MDQDKLLSVIDITRELNLGKASTKFLLKRFKKFIPTRMVDGQPHYPKPVVNTLFTIQSRLDMGILPGDIEKQLSAGQTDETVSTDAEPVLNYLNRALGHDQIHTTLKSVFNEIGEQQKRIANAHEKRAEAEERKAVAIEKRADAEEKKADAMNNIAKALQEMNRLRSSDPVLHQVAQQSVGAVTEDEHHPPNYDTDDLDNRTDSELIDSILKEDLPSTHEEDLVDDMDLDLSSLLDDDSLDSDEFDMGSLVKDTDPAEPDDSPDHFDGDSLDDLTALLDESTRESETEISTESDDLSKLLDEIEESDPELDDLTRLLDDTGISGPEPANEMDKTDLPDLDDLSLLIEEPQSEKESTEPAVKPDDLSKLLDLPHTESPKTALDDLYALVDTQTVPTDGSAAMDDLSQLIDSSDSPLDDLSKLIDLPASGKEGVQPPSPEEPKNRKESADTDAIKIDITPKEDLEKYKAAVMQVIIGLKTDGLSVEETTDRLNKNRVETLSGKPEWSRKAISQIYKFIDAAKS